jgi:hypothetical protein
MKRVYFDGSEGSDNIKLNTAEDLKKLVANLDVHGEVEHKVNDLYIVKSMSNMGGSQYLANGIQDVEILKRISEKVENKGDSTWYYIRLAGQEVTI